MFTTNSKLNFECGMRSGYICLKNEKSSEKNAKKRKFLS